MIKLIRFPHLTIAQIVEEEAAKRIELLVKRRVDEELERRKDEIELEVTRRVESAKQQMEQEMMAELERRRAQAREDERKREVGFVASNAAAKKLFVFFAVIRFVFFIFPFPIIPSLFLNIFFTHNFCGFR